MRTLITILTTLSIAALARADTIQLRDTIRVTEGTPITLGLVAELTGDSAQSLSHKSFTPKTNPQGHATLSARDVRAALTESGTNWALLTLRGGPTTIVFQPAHAEPTPVATPAAPRRASSAPEPIGPTLRDAVARQIGFLFSAAPEDVRLTFDPRDAELLRTPTAGRIVDIQPIGTSERLPLRITIYQGQQIVLTEAIRVEVLTRRTTAVAQRTIARGQRLTHDDITPAEQWLPPSDPIATPAEALASATRGRIEAGATIRAADLEPPILIERGDRVALHTIVGSIVIRTEARARHDARDGETIELETLDNSRKRLLATVSGPGRAVTNTTTISIGQR